MSEVNGMKLRADEVRRNCPPSCRRNMKHELCACAPSAKIISKIIISARWDGVKRYSAWFTPLTDKEIAAREKKSGKKETPFPKISNQYRYDDRGKVIQTKGVFIPDNIYREMVAMALAIVMKAPYAPEAGEIETPQE
jgi:hypothetical protein